jgi:branched-subunit amino acid aminotransferase/4-amino-4-deoxychorismate lyase
MGLTVEESHAAPADLTHPEAMFLTNSLVGLRPVSGLDGKLFEPNAVIGRLAKLLQSFA